MKIRKTPFYIGKDDEKNDAIISDRVVSRMHAKIVVEQGKAYIIDQESTNGTFLNGKQLVPWERCLLRQGDVIGFAFISYRTELV